MVFVKEETEENMSEPETWRIKHEEPETWKLKHEDPETWKIKQEEPEAWRIKHEEPEPWKLKHKEPETWKIKQEEPETWRIKHEEPETWRIKHEEPETWRIKHEEPETWRIKHEEPETWRIKHEEPESLRIKHKEQGELIEETEKHEESSEVEEKNHVTTEEKPLSWPQTKLKDLKKRRAKKSFTCTQCGKSFTDKTSLDIHMRVHTGEKPFTCDQPRKSFTQSANLNGHMNIHTGEKQQHHHTMSKRGGGLKKTCPACKKRIFNGFKMCPYCKATQPKNLRLKKKIEKIEQKKATWVANNKRNQVISHLLDDAVILIEKLHAVGWRPLLLLEYPQKKAKLILPKDLALGTNAQTCVKNIHEIFKIMVEGNTNQATESSQEPEEATVILHLETLVKPSTAEQDLTATTCLDQRAGTMDGPECNLSLLPTGQDLTATTCLDQEVGTTDGAESNLSPLPTGQDYTATTVMDQEAGTTVDPEQDLNLPPTGQGTRRIRRKKVGTKQKDCPHSNWEVHPYKGIIRTRQRKGKTEHLYDWMPCKLCGKTWPPTWEAA